MPTTTRECEAISKELQDRYELDDELDLKEIAPLMLQLREALPPASFKFLLTLCESVFSKLDPDLVQVPVMKKKLEAALAAQAKTLGRRGGEDAATEPPDRLFDRLAGALSSMLRDVVPDHEKCVREARGRAIVESEAAEQAAANADKSAAKAAKKEKLRLEAASRRERLKKEKGGERPSVGSVTKEVDQLALRSGDTSEGSDDARSRGGSAPQTPDRKSSEPTGSREEPAAA